MRRIAHPRRNDGPPAAFDRAHEDDLTAPLLAVLNVEIPAERGVELVVDPRAKCDMGRMTLGLSSSA